MTSLGVERGWVLGVGLAVVLVAAAFGVVSAILPADVRERVYAGEGSIVEWVSLVQWALLGLALALIVGRMSWGIAGAMIVLLACAAREGDLHKALTGYSVLKPKFYFSGEFPLHERAIAAVIVGAVITGLVVACAAMKRHAERDGWLRARWVRLVALTLVLGVASKVIDRAPGVLKDAGVPMGEPAREVAKAVEENFEVLMPFVLLGAAVAFARKERVEGSRDA